MDRETMGAWDLVDKQDKPKDYTLEIERVESHIVKSAERPKGERKPHIFFKGAKKPLVAGATICKTIEDIAGTDDFPRWVGLKITLFATRVRGKGGGQCWGIRVRPMKARGPAEELAGQPVDVAIREEQHAAHREPGDDDT